MFQLSQIVSENDTLSIAILTVDVKKEREIIIKMHCEWAFVIWGDHSSSVVNHVVQHTYKNAGTYNILIAAENLIFLDFMNCFCIHADLSGCPRLIEAFCSLNKLITLNVCKCKKLQTLVCNYNNLKTLDVAGLDTLTDLRCHNNKLVNLSLSGCSGLSLLDCKRNYLNEINLNDCLNIDFVNCSNNRLEGEALNKIVKQLPWFPMEKGTFICNNNSGYKFADFSELPFKGFKLLSKKGKT